MQAEEKYARRAFKLGAAAYITKDSPRAEFANAMNKVLKGGRYVGAALAEKLIVDWKWAQDRATRILKNPSPTDTRP